MYQYKGYNIIISNCNIWIYSSSGKRYGPFTTCKEAEEYINELEGA